MSDIEIEQEAKKALARRAACFKAAFSFLHEGKSAKKVAEIFELDVVNAESVEQALNEYALGFYFQERTERSNKGDYFRYQLSTGGPGDEIRFYVSRDGEVRYAEYVYLEWFNSFEIDITDEGWVSDLWNHLSLSGDESYLNSLRSA